MKQISLLLALFALSLSAQQVVEIRQVRIPYLSQQEKDDLGAAVPEGTLFFLENTTELYVATGDEDAPPFVRLNPEQVEWSHLATRTVDMAGNDLLFDGRYAFGSEGASWRLTGNGTTLIRVSGNTALLKIEDITATATEITLEIDASAADITPVVEYCLDLEADPQVWTEVESYTLDPTVSGADGRVVATIVPHQGDPAEFAPFYRVQIPGPYEAPEIELLGDVSVSGDLTVSGSIAGDGSSLTGVNAETLDGIDSTGFVEVGDLATATAAGIVELATEAETVTGTNTARAVTPAGVKAATDALVPFSVGFAAEAGGGSNTAGNWGMVTFGTELVDTDAAFNGSRFTVPETGLYHINGHIVFNGSSDQGRIIVGIYKNGVLSHLLGRGSGSGDVWSGFGGSVIMQLSAGDYIELWGLNDKATTYQSSPDGYTHFSAWRIR